MRLSERPALLIGCSYIFVLLIITFKQRELNRAHSFAHSFDFVLDLERGQSLVVEHLADLSTVKLKVAVREVDEGNAPNEEQHVGIVALTLRLKRIVA